MAHFYSNVRHVRSTGTGGTVVGTFDTWLIRCILPVLAAAAAGPTLAQTATGIRLPQIETHDNLRSAGRLENGVLSLSMWAGVGRWYPEGEGLTPRIVEAFGEEGGPLSIPSPLIQAPEGTLVKVAIRNTLASQLRVHGFCDRPGVCEPVMVPPGATRDVQFALHAGGTFHYWATTSEAPLRLREGSDSQLGGAIVSDPAGSVSRDRVFVMGLKLEESGETSASELTVINGRSWPHTERLQYAVGDTARWRILNLTSAAHAMHLHGFFYTVESVGDGATDTKLSAAERRLAVTEPMLPGRTLTLSWIPERAGNWLFHCHMLVHMLPPEMRHGGLTTLGASETHPQPESPQRGHAVGHGSDPAAGMAGLVLGIHVTGTGPTAPAPDLPRRQIQLTVEPDNRHGATPAYKVALVTGTQLPPRISDGAVPGPIMVLTRGEPVSVEVINRLSEPTAIHWHGIELESYDDGVPGFGGSGGSVTPPVEPGGTFTAHFTPSRAGTFIYHTHWHKAEQLSAGIYGPLIVLEPGQTYDPVTDHLIVLGLDGPNLPPPNEPLVVNGDPDPRPLDLRAGMPHRLRFINITANNVALTVQLLSGFDPIRWTFLGKDGYEVPPAQRAEHPARQLVTVGETYDFELAPMPPRADGLWLELRRGNGELLFQWPVRVR